MDTLNTLNGFTRLPQHEIGWEITIFYSRRVDLHWVTSLVKGIPTSHSNFRDLIASVQSAKTPTIIRRWFDCVQRTILQHGNPDDIYHFDETGFAMGSILTVKVIRAEYYGRRLLLPRNREWITTIECARALPKSGACGNGLGLIMKMHWNTIDGGGWSTRLWNTLHIWDKRYSGDFLRSQC